MSFLWFPFPPSRFLIVSFLLTAIPCQKPNRIPGWALNNGFWGVFPVVWFLWFFIILQWVLFLFDKNHQKRHFSARAGILFVFLGYQQRAFDSICWLWKTKHIARQSWQARQKTSNNQKHPAQQTTLWFSKRFCCAVVFSTKNNKLALQEKPNNSTISFKERPVVHNLPCTVSSTRQMSNIGITVLVGAKDVWQMFEHIILKYAPKTIVVNSRNMSLFLLFT